MMSDRTRATLACLLHSAPRACEMQTGRRMSSSSMSNAIRITPDIDYLLDRDIFHFSAQAPLSRPLSVCLHVNHWCNLECSYCLSDSGPREPRAEGMLEPVMTALSSWSPLRVVWSGGEPALFGPIGALVTKARAGSLINVLTSNGSAVPNADILASTDWLDISVHGVDRATFLQTTRRDQFDKVMENVRLLAAGGIRVSASIVLHRRFVPGLIELVKRLSDLGVRKFRVSRLLPLGRGSTDMDGDPSDEEVLKIRDELLSVANGMTIVLPATRKRRALLDGYFVVENDGCLSSPPALVGKLLWEVSQAGAWKHALEAHRFLFDGISD